MRKYNLLIHAKNMLINFIVYYNNNEYINLCSLLGKNYPFSV